MAALLQQLSDAYNEIVASGDRRTNKLPFVGSPIPMALTIVLYITFTQLAPVYFKNRKPANIRSLIIFYNFCLVFLSAYMFKEFVMAAYVSGYNYMCQSMDYSLGAKTMRMANVTWLFYVSKIIELLDTVFIIVRKKSQLTFLHVFHHSTVIFDEWTFVKYYPCSHAFFHALCNCFVHTIMYLYYFLACFPQLRKYLWWKKYLTSLQMIQFVLCLAHIISGLYNGCEFPIWASFLGMSEFVALFILFGKYYLDTYSTKREGHRKKSE